MLRELAITPDVFDRGPNGSDHEAGVELREVLRDCVASGLIGNLDKGRWLATIKGLLAEEHWDKGPKDRTLRRQILEIMHLLEKRARIVRHPLRMQGHPSSDQEWLELAVESHGRVAFDRIIVGGDRDKYDTDGQVIDHINDVRHTTSWYEQRTSRSVSMTEPGFRQILSPLLRHVQRTKLIDPHLEPAGPGQLKSRIIEVCAELMGDRGHVPLQGCIEIHTAAKGRDPKAYLDEWKDRLTSLRDRRKWPHRFVVSLWGQWDVEDGVEGAEFHDRFLLTTQCGVTVPGGFDCEHVRSRRSSTWTLLDHQAWHKHWYEFEHDPINPCTRAFRTYEFIGREIVK